MHTANVTYPHIIWMKKLTRHDTFAVEVLLWIFSQEAGDNLPARCRSYQRFERRRNRLVREACPLCRNVIATMLLLRTESDTVSDTEFDTDR